MATKTKPAKAATLDETHGEVFATSPAYRDKIVAGQHATDPIRAKVARLQAEGMTGEQAWTEVLRHVNAVGGKF